MNETLLSLALIQIFLLFWLLGNINGAIEFPGFDC